MLNSGTNIKDPVVCEKCGEPSVGRDKPVLVMVGFEARDRGNFKTWAQAQENIKWVCEPCVYKAILAAP